MQLNTDISYCNSIVIGALESEHDASVVVLPGCRHPHFPVIPHPTDVVLDADILCDVIPTGGNWHQNRLSALQRQIRANSSLGKTSLPIHDILCQWYIGQLDVDMSGYDWA